MVDRPGKYAIQDLGSAGGTFIRIQTGQKKRLHAGKENNFFIRKNEIDVKNIFSSFLPLWIPVAKKNINIKNNFMIIVLYHLIIKNSTKEEMK